MDERTIKCRDGSSWRVYTPGRSSLYRIDLVFESLDEPKELLRGEAPADGLEALTDEQLCFLVRDLRQSGR